MKCLDIGTGRGRWRSVWVMWLGVVLVVGWRFGVGVASGDGEQAGGPAFSRPGAAEPMSVAFGGPSLGSLYAPSEAIFPEQDLPLRFFHDKHVTVAKMACEACHAQALTSTQASDRLLPSMQVCLSCHALDEAGDNFPRTDGGPPPADCTTCHLSYIGDPPRFDDDVEEVDESNFMEVENPPLLPHIPNPNLHFPHKDHIDAKIACAQCHGTMEDVQLATRHNLPTMDLCLDCHTSASDAPPDACNTCHLTEADGRLKTAFQIPAVKRPNPIPQVAGARLTMLRFDAPPAMVEEGPGGERALLLMPTGRFRPDDHRFDYLEKHRRTASSDEAYCSSCHSKAFCTDCHNGVIKPAAIHPPGYAQTHAIDAYSDETQCSSCHNRQDFCLTCHQQQGLTVANAFEDGFKYHPAGWVRTVGGEIDTGLRSEHSVAAQRNIGACSSCHDEQLCVGCHSTQSFDRVNPHPTNWTSRCASLFQRNNNACLKCHLISDPLLDMCR